MASTMVNPGGNNTFIPSSAASGNLIYTFLRPQSSFALNQYCQRTPVKKRQFYYGKLDWKNAGRTDWVEPWVDGDDRPSGRGKSSKHQFILAETVREETGDHIGNLAIDQADWNIVNSHSAILGQRSMTKMTRNLITLATTEANHLSGHVIDVTASSADEWNLSTTATLRIKKSIDAAREQIGKATLSALDGDDILLVLSPSAAYKVAQSQELVDYLKQSPDAYEQIKGISRSNNPNAKYGLPRTIYGATIVVEATRYTSGSEAAPTITEVLAAATPFVTVRPRSVVGVEGSPSTSALSLFAYTTMDVRTKRDTDHEYTWLSVVNDYKAVLTAPEAIVMFKNAIA